MKKAISIVALSATFLAGCASHEHHMRQLGDRLHASPIITVRYGTVSIAPEPIVLDLRVTNPAISWRAPAGFTFPTDAQRRGIEFLGLVVDAKGNPVNLRTDPNALKAKDLSVQGGGREHFECKFSDREVTCVPVAGKVVKNGVYRYAIRLRDKDGKLFDGDPHVTPAD